MVSPAGASTHRARIENTLLKALALAFRWKRMLDSGDFVTIADFIRREVIAVSCLTPFLGLTLLAPDIVETIEARTLNQSTIPDGLERRALVKWQK